ncbi:unnamed protein product [Rotaria sp. Silwood2]|nr:unnamed protein product [Rotaria sp. Silwood2]CAF4514796.1 unnamed protein product [Rotaria sp. Silwood2]
MPKEFSVGLKEVYFRVIKFVEKEKNGPTIPLNLTMARILAMLNISRRSLFNLKTELKTKDKEIEEEEEAKQVEEEDEIAEKMIEQKRLTLRSRSASVTKISSFPSTSTSTVSLSAKNPPARQKRNFSASPIFNIITVPNPQPQKKKLGSVATRLSEEADECIRYTFHLLLAEKTYLTTELLLQRLLGFYPDFPVTSIISRWCHLKRIGFSYKAPSKLSIPLDSVSFMAQRTYYFRKLDEFREDNVLMFYHDETWTNAGEEKRSVWIDETGAGRLRKSEGKG